jgi:hypothetical protein
MDRFVIYDLKGLKVIEKEDSRGCPITTNTFSKKFVDELTPAEVFGDMS